MKGNTKDVTYHQNGKVEDPDVDYETEKTYPIYDENGKKTDFGMS